MPRRFSNDTLIIGGALLFGLFSLAAPLAVLMWAPDSEFRTRPRPRVERRSTLLRNPRSADLKGERLAFGGNCGVGEFKDGRDIEVSIRRQFATYRLDRLEVRVSQMCVAAIRGEVRDEREGKLAVRAAGHPWIRFIDIAGMQVSGDSSPPDAPRKAGR